MNNFKIALGAAAACCLSASAAIAKVENEPTSLGSIKQMIEDQNTKIDNKFDELYMYLGLRVLEENAELGIWGGAFTSQL